MKTITYCFIFLFFSSFDLLAEPALYQWLPSDFDSEISLIEETPYEVLNTTNAYKVFGAKYYKNDKLWVDVFASWTKKEQFDHAVNLVYRSKGNYLDALETIEIEDKKFIISTYTKSDNSIEYIVSFDLEHNYYDTLRLHSSWYKDDFLTVNPIYHYELTFMEKEEIEYFLIHMLDRIGEFAHLEYLSDSFMCPKTYVKTYSQSNDFIDLEIYNEHSSIESIVRINGEEQTIQLNDESIWNYQVDLSNTENALLILEGLENDLDAVLIKSDFVNISFDLDVNTAKIYPNPSSDFLIIDLKRDAELKICNQLGGVVYKPGLISGKHSIDIRQWNPGTYYITYTYERERITKKVIVI